MEGNILKAEVRNCAPFSLAQVGITLEMISRDPLICTNKNDLMSDTLRGTVSVYNSLVRGPTLACQWCFLQR